MRKNRKLSVVITQYTASRNRIKVDEAI